MTRKMFEPPAGSADTNICGPKEKKKKKIGGLQSGTRYRLINGFQLKIFARHGFSSCLSFVWKWELEMRVQQTISSYIRLLFGWQHRPSIFWVPAGRRKFAQLPRNIYAKFSQYPMNWGK